MLNFPSRRPVVTSKNGMVATSQPLAARVGLKILMDGGNAIDAAVAMAAMLNVVEPMSTGVGGDAFALTYNAKTDQLTALNASGRAPNAISIDAVKRLGHTEMPETGPLSITVPGTVDGWEKILQQHGSMLLSEVLKPAIQYAEQGFPVTPIIANEWHEHEEILHSTPYLINGHAPRAGQIFKNPDLAQTLRIIAEGGSDAFYRGSIAKQIAQHVQSQGGYLSATDFAQHTSTWDIPVSTVYRDAQIFECPPNGQGIIALMALNILEGFDLQAMGYGSVAYYHHVIEALKLAFADGFAHIADPNRVAVPIEKMLDKEYAASRRKLINPNHASRNTTTGLPRGGTVYLTSIDKDRNACSFINSIYYGFGSGVMVPGTGIVLQNRGTLFSLDEAHPNSLAPGKRPFHTIIPAMAFKNGKLWSSFGVMGGHIQPQGHVQVMLNSIDFKLNPQRAIDAPRVVWYEGNQIDVESPIESAPLQSLGHEIISARGRYGGGQMIVIDQDNGALLGGSDPRKDGCAIGY
ncbi:MAG TPA: gamma-glutamyltransferase [Anaerolineae bacterium]|nr:gamma-glutamyltransferase [Anaerolineae bacterium]